MAPNQEKPGHTVYETHERIEAGSQEHTKPLTTSVGSRLDHVTQFATLALAVLFGASLIKEFWIKAVPVSPVTSPSPISDPPPGATLNLRGMPTLGGPDAAVVLVEFSDYECPFCKRHVRGVMKELVDKFISTGKVRYAFANNTLPSHQNARLLATAAICAGQQNRYWQMHDMLFDRDVNALSELEPLVRELDLDASAFKKCLSSPEPQERIRSDMQQAERLTLRGTPTFALGRTTQEGQLHVEKLIVGLQAISVFEKAIGSVR